MIQLTLTQAFNARSTSYVAVALLLASSGFLLKDIDWQGSVWLHTLMESLATLLAFVVGAMALVRYFSQRDSEFLYIGSGFFGTALLDAYHTLVTSVFFQPYMPSAYPQLTPWSWIASRFFLSVLMFISWRLWYRHRDDSTYRHRPSWVFAITGLATLACFLLFSIMPLPSFTVPQAMIPRPFDLLPAVFFYWHWWVIYAKANGVMTILSTG